MSAPWMPLYVADYLADTGHLSAAEHGAYMLLIMHYWRQGSLPDDESALSRIARMTAREWTRSRETLAAFFERGWKHERIEKELSRANVKSDRRSQAGSRGGHAKALKTKEAALANASELPDKSLAKPLASSSQPQSDDTSLRSVSNARRREFSQIFWPRWPHKVARDPAERAFLRVRQSVELDVIMAGVDRYVASKPPDRSWMNPATFLNGGRWRDDPAAESPNARAGPREDGLTKVLNELNGSQNGSANHHNIRDITPAGPSEPRGRDPDPRLHEPPRNASGGQVLDLRPAGADAYGQAAASGTAWRFG